LPLRKNMNAYQDVMGLTRLPDFAWEPAQMPSRKFSMVVTQVLFVLLAYTLLQAHLFLATANR
jgi:hypothetical protein